MSRILIGLKNIPKYTCFPQDTMTPKHFLRKFCLYLTQIKYQTFFAQPGLKCLRQESENDANFKHTTICKSTLGLKRFLLCGNFHFQRKIQTFVAYCARPGQKPVNKTALLSQLVWQTVSCLYKQTLEFNKTSISLEPRRIAGVDRNNINNVYSAILFR